jgi:hypothetical protein
VEILSDAISTWSDWLAILENVTVDVSKTLSTQSKRPHMIAVGGDIVPGKGI